MDNKNVNNVYTYNAAVETALNVLANCEHNADLKNKSMEVINLSLDKLKEYLNA